ncbi:NAD(P)H-dependent oxidoreductase [Aeromonas caviae]
MTPNLLVLNGNPKPDSLCHALAREYARSAEQGGARVTLHHVGELAFAPDLHHGYDEAQPLEPDLQAVQQSLVEAHHLVIVAPVWYLFTRTGLTASVLPGWDNLSSRCTP